MIIQTKMCDIRPHGDFMQVEIDVDADELLFTFGDGNRGRGIAKMLDDIGIEATIGYFGKSEMLMKIWALLKEQEIPTLERS